MIFQSQRASSSSQNATRQRRHGHTMSSQRTDHQMHSFASPPYQPISIQIQASIYRLGRRPSRRFPHRVTPTPAGASTTCASSPRALQDLVPGNRRAAAVRACPQPSRCRGRQSHGRSSREVSGSRRRRARVCHFQARERARSTGKLGARAALALPLARRASCGSVGWMDG